MDATIETDEKFNNILDRAKAAGLDAELDAIEYEDDADEIIVNIAIPAGKNKIHLNVDLDSADEFSNIEFEKYKFVDGYYAIYCPDENWIEVLVESASGLSSGTLFRRLHRAIGTERKGPPYPTTPEELGPIDVSNEEKGTTIRMGAVSELANTFFLLSELRLPRWGRGISLRIGGIDLDRHELAVRAIERLANSFLFQVELHADLGLYIAPTRDTRSPRISLRDRAKDPVILTVPDVEYDQAPLSLYWYSRVAESMPLLQFLALYQTIEYFFPVYSVLEAQRVLTTKIKDPTFNFDRPTDVAKLLQALKISNRGGYGSEREQLVSVIENCVEEDELITFLAEADDRKEFYRDKNKHSHVSQVKIPNSGPDGTVTRAVADRLYDVRCRIVHAKAEQDQDVAVILPFSKAAQLMTHDVALARFVARKTLVAGGTKLRL